MLADAIRIELLPNAPEIDVRGDGVSIVAGDTSPSQTDFTDFGASAAASRTFTIHNSGGDVLTIGSIVTTGGHSAEFVVSGAPASVPAGGSASFLVTFTAGGAVGVRTTTLTVNSDDADEAAYNFDIQATGSAAYIIDNGDPDYSSTGFGTRTGYGFQSDVAFASSGNGSSTATWTFPGLAAGNYQVSTTWAAHPNRATDAPYTVSDGAVPLSTVDVNQQLASNDRNDAGTDWKDLGIFTITGNTLVVQLSNDADGYVLADAIRIELVP